MFKTIIALLCSGVAVFGQNFSLHNDEYMEIAGSYENGELFDNSKADVVAGGYVGWFEVHQNSLTNIFGGYIDGFLTFEASVANVDGGYIDNLCSLGSSQVKIVDGDIGWLSSYEDSVIDIQGGDINRLIVGDLVLNGPARVNVAGGEVNKLETCIAIKDSHVVYDKKYTLDDLRNYGVLVSDSVAVKDLNISFDIYNGSSINVTDDEIDYINLLGGSALVQGGNINDIHSGDDGHIDISGGDVFFVGLSDSSTVNISGGNVDCMTVFENSSVTINGGTIGEITSADGSYVAINNGSVGTLNVFNMRTDSDVKVSITGGYVDHLKPFITLETGEIIN